MNAARPFPLFSRIGVELEYMIVSQAGLSVLPITDQLIQRETGSWQADADRGDLAWSNELVLHVLELKTNGPAHSVAGLAGRFQTEVCHINHQLQALNARLMPTGMHPWMNPLAETRLWPHEGNPIYETYHRIFNCHRHGWANLQSMHLNLPFADDTEFARLHAAIRLVLPIIPALAASSPLQDGSWHGNLDQRLVNYRTNSSSIPAITGRVIPEPVFNRHDYETQILQPLYRNISPLDPQGLLQDEYLNSRGAIARFCRNSIEIRLLDTQECPAADMAIATAVVAVIRALVEERWCDLEFQKSFRTELLEKVLLATMVQSDETPIEDRQYRQAFGMTHESHLTAREMWRTLLEQVMKMDTPDATQWRQHLDCILSQGCLARRILRATGSGPSRPRLQEVYARLCECLETGVLFIP